MLTKKRLHPTYTSVNENSETLSGSKQDASGEGQHPKYISLYSMRCEKEVSTLNCKGWSKAVRVQPTTLADAVLCTQLLQCNTLKFLGENVIHLLKTCYISSVVHLHIGDRLTQASI